ncbi:MAG: ThiF family adenylyltransferase [Phycisphaerae bacterium]
MDARVGNGAREHVAAGGRGHPRICDRDYIELTNSQRQVLFDEDDIEQNVPKAVAEQTRLRYLSIRVEPIVTDVNFKNIANLADAAM